MTTGSFGSSWFQYFLCLFHQKVWSVIFLNHFWDPSGWGLIFSKKPKSRGFFFRSSMGHLLSESCRKMSYAFFTSQLLGRTVRGIKLEDERLKPEMMVWFRWFSFSNGWFLGSKAVNFQRCILHDLFENYFELKDPQYFSSPWRPNFSLWPKTTQRL